MGLHRFKSPELAFQMPVGDRQTAPSECDQAAMFQAGPAEGRDRLPEALKVVVTVPEDEVTRPCIEFVDDLRHRDVATVNQGLGAGIDQQGHGCRRPGYLIVRIGEDSNFQ